VTRTITDSRGRQWHCEQLSMGREVAEHSVPGSPLPNPAEAGLRCARGNQRVMIRAPAGWEQMPEADLVALLESKLRERGHA
jgi:hypothetical protein